MWQYWAQDWSLFDKVEFDGINRIIYVHPEVTELNIRTDVYTSWVDWMVIRDHLKFLPAMRTTGLDPIGGGVYTGDVYFLINGWKLSVDTRKVKITGVLFSDDYDTAYYTPEMVAQYPVSVSSLVTTTTIYQNVVTGTAATPAEIWEHATRTLTTNAGGATLEEIENSTVLAKQSTLLETKVVAEHVGDQVWSAPIAIMTDPTTIGGYIGKKLLSVAKFIGLK